MNVRCVFLVYGSLFQSLFVRSDSRDVLHTVHDTQCTHTALCVCLRMLCAHSGKTRLVCCVLLTRLPCANTHQLCPSQLLSTHPAKIAVFVESCCFYNNRQWQTNLAEEGKKHFRITWSSTADEIEWGRIIRITGPILETLRWDENGHKMTASIDGVSWRLCGNCFVKQKLFVCLCSYIGDRIFTMQISNSYVNPTFV